ncbi:MAG TPA: hypothetical protein VKA67_10490, partial [Verrucomicrobiae bacterium]|nr:hypothetical protein [Verrucomicrobiae bacterium]
MRRIELQTGVDNWTAQGGATAMLSLTVQHEKHEPLSEVLADLTKAHGGLWSGRAGVALRAEFGIAGRVRAVEVTHGGNGWHPHAHVLLFLTRPLSELALNSLETAVSERWQKIVDRRYKRYASIERGAKLTFAGNNASGYITKIGRDWTAAHELAKAAVKVGRVDNRTPSKLLGDSLE